MTISGTLHDGYQVQCCGGEVVSDQLKCCGNVTMGQAYIENTDNMCCGSQYVPEETSVCCTDEMGRSKVRYDKLFFIPGLHGVILNGNSVMLLYLQGVT